MRRLSAALATMVAATVATACTSPSTGQTTLTVFAAASLTESFGALKNRFEAQHAGVTVTYNFAGSSALVQQLTNGAKADVFASADQPTMDKAVKADLIDGTPAVFATNRLTIAVAPGNPKGIKGLRDLARGGLTVVVCAPQVPCGAATRKVEQETHVTLTPASEEQDVKQVLTKVEAGDADAGLVYLTDAASAGGKVTRVDFPESAQAVNNYPIAVVKGAPQADLARQFEQLVLSDQGRQELAKAGFGSP